MKPGDLCKKSLVLLTSVGLSSIFHITTYAVSCRFQLDIVAQSGWMKNILIIMKKKQRYQYSNSCCILRLLCKLISLSLLHTFDVS